MKKTAHKFEISRALTILLLVMSFIFGYLVRMYHESYWESSLVPIAKLHKSYFPKDKFTINHQGKGFVITRKDEK